MDYKIYKSPKTPMNEKFIWIFCQHCIVFKQTNFAQALKSLDVKAYIFVMQETSRPACDLMESFIRPRAARNTDLEWRFIVNDLEVLVWCSCIHFWTAFWDTKCYNCWDFLLRWYTIIMYQSHLNRIQYQLAQQENKKPQKEAVNHESSHMNTCIVRRTQSISRLCGSASVWEIMNAVDLGRDR